MNAINSDLIDQAGLTRRVLDRLPVGVTIIDPDGRILYYNKAASRIVDRKPEYIGRDVRPCHQKPGSIEKLDRILESFKAGRREDVTYEAVPYGRRLAVTVSPIEHQGRLAAVMQTVRPIEPAAKDNP